MMRSLPPAPSRRSFSAGALDDVVVVVADDAVDEVGAGDVLDRDQLVDVAFAEGEALKQVDEHPVLDLGVAGGVEPGAPVQGVAVLDERVGLRRAVETAVEKVVTLAAEQHVVAGIAVDVVVAAEALQGVVACEAVHEVAGGAADQVIAEGGATNDSH